MKKVRQMEDRIALMIPVLNEKQRRLFLASEAKSFDRGDVSEVSRLSGVSRTTIWVGMRELENNDTIDLSRVRKVGGGRTYVEDHIPNIQKRIGEIVDGATYGNPEKLLSWTPESLWKIQAALLAKCGIDLSFKTVGAILEDLGYSKPGNQKMLQTGAVHPDRNAQFEFINKKAKACIDSGEPVISGDTKKKEHMGNFKNHGTEYRRIKDPRKVLDHDFPITELGKSAPYGVYHRNHTSDSSMSGQATIPRSSPLRVYRVGGKLSGSVHFRMPQSCLSPAAATAAESGCGNPSLYRLRDVSD
jgi:hypothetical protein